MPSGRGIQGVVFGNLRNLPYYFDVENDEVGARLLASFFPALLLKCSSFTLESKTLVGLRTKPDLYAAVWLPLTLSFLSALGHPSAVSLLTYFFVIGRGLALLYACVLLGAVGLHLLTHALRLRSKLAVLVCALSYSLAPFLVPVVLHNRRLQHLGNELPWRDATLAFAALCGFAFLACCLVKFTEAERPNLAVYRSQAMAVLHLEATSRATPLLPLKTAAGASGCASIRGLLSIAILLIASAGEHIVLGALLREQLRGEWGSTAAAVVAGLGLERELLAPPPPALAQVTAVADLHAKYAQATEELGQMKGALAELQSGQAQLKQVAESDSGARADEGDLVDIRERLNMVLQQLSELRAPAQAATVVGAAGQADGGATGIEGTGTGEPPVAAAAPPGSHSPLPSS
ncbi:hypothetical protein CYMTET_47436 [Cymbomonas tetramitiformis]|uniref:Uncharacterized protein n=1 Tax=Cymbomonas tetramitiformis TaxID=36881 RepID=A0AAE0EXQ7_9CHLO|nr:hypothetical protein CYMTET_47436 [Cymbomonas tetramitiformis]